MLQNLKQESRLLKLQIFVVFISSIKHLSINNGYCFYPAHALNEKKKEKKDHWKVANIPSSSPTRADNNTVTLINCSSFTKV